MNVPAPARLINEQNLVVDAIIEEGVTLPVHVTVPEVSRLNRRQRAPARAKNVSATRQRECARKRIYMVNSATAASSAAATTVPRWTICAKGTNEKRVLFENNA